jgi:hypothetical protein
VYGMCVWCVVCGGMEKEVSLGWGGEAMTTWEIVPGTLWIPSISNSVPFFSLPHSLHW